MVVRNTANRNNLLTRALLRKETTGVKKQLAVMYRRRATSGEERTPRRAT